MSLSGLALKLLGPALAKWLLDAFDIPSNLTNKILEQAIDVAADGFSESDKREQIGQKVEQIARQLAEQMRPLFEHEARNIPPNSREAILLEVAETLIRGNLTVDSIIEMDLSYQQLYQHLISVNPEGGKFFSLDEKSVYEQTLLSASQYLLQSLPQLDGFQLSFSQRTLHQLNEVVEYIFRQKIQAIQKADEFCRRYLEIVERELDKPEVFGIPHLKPTLSRQKLCEAYIQLRITEEVDDKIESIEELADFQIANDRDRFSQEFSQLDKVISSHCRLVIRGDAGAGKTSLLRWLAVHAARKDFIEPLQTWNYLVPFFIQLRSWVDKGFPTPENFVQPLAKNIADLMPSGWVRTQLDRGWALVLVDGVDELPREARQGFFEALKKLVDEFPQAIYIVTSRPAGLKDINGEVWTEWEEWVKSARFKNCSLQPMSLLDVEEFITRWHNSLPEDKQTDGQEKNPEQIAETLKQQLRQRLELRQIASTPLLCAMICALHYENEGTLPSTRIRLYEDCITMLLQKRDEQRGIKASISLNLDHKIDLLSEFAYWLMRNNYSDIEIDRADKYFEGGLRDYHFPQELSGQDIRLFLLERSGLIREPVVGRIDFIHRTFQEYLAAKAIIANEDIGSLLGNANNDQWREVIVVTAGLASLRQRKELLLGLLKQQGNYLARFVKGEEKLHKEKRYLHFLAFACLETSVRVEPDLRNKILENAKQLLPPKDEDEIAMVVRAGDAIVSFFEFDQKLTISQAINCIRALIGIGSKKSMQKLVAFAAARQGISFERVENRIQSLGIFSTKSYSFNRIIGEKSKFVGKKNGFLTYFDPLAYTFGQGWDIFDRELYIREVLSYLKSLSLSGTEVQDLTPLTELTQLELLDLSGTEVQDLTPLAELTQLKFLDLSDTKIQDFIPLADLAQLKLLNLVRVEIQDLTSLVELIQLQYLSLSGTGVQDLTPLAELTQLKFLDLSGTEVQDLTPLAELTQLKFLDLSGTEVQDLTPLAELTQLERLDLSGTKIQDLALLAKLTQLNELILSRTLASSLYQVKGIKNVRFRTTVSRFRL